MPGKTGSTDAFANVATITMVESAANTLTFKKLETGISLSEKVAWVISRIEYNLASAIPGQMNAAADSICYGLSVSNVASAMNTFGAFTDPSLIDWNMLSRQDFGTPATGFLWDNVYLKDFSSMPGGGLIVPPQPLYGFIQGSSLGAAASIVAKLFYTLLQLSVDQYWELVEARRILAS